MVKMICKNNRAYFDYEILEKLEAGIKLSGAEVKAVKLGDCSLRGSYVKVLGEEVFVLGMHIGRYKKAAYDPDYDSKQTRKLLLKKSEIKKLIGVTSQKGLSVVPLKVYLKGSLIKLEIGVGKGRKKYDKRELLKRREMEREVERIVREKL